MATKENKLVFENQLELLKHILNNTERLTTYQLARVATIMGVIEAGAREANIFERLVDIENTEEPMVITVSLQLHDMDGQQVIMEFGALNGLFDNYRVSHYYLGELKSQWVSDPEADSQSSQTREGIKKLSHLFTILWVERDLLARVCEHIFEGHPLTYQYHIDQYDNVLVNAGENISFLMATKEYNDGEMGYVIRYSFDEAVGNSLTTITNSIEKEIRFTIQKDGEGCQENYNEAMQRVIESIQTIDDQAQVHGRIYVGQID